VTHPGPSPLALAALPLLDEGADVAALAARFAEAGAMVQPETAERVLDELAGLGLARVARGTGLARMFVPTSLGLRAAGPLGDHGSAIALRDLEEMRTDLLSTIAHELRTPLTAIRTSVGILRDPTSDPDPTQRGSLLETIERNAVRMQRLVGDTLDLTRFRAGRIQLQLRRFDAVGLARSVVASLAPEAGPRVGIDAPDAPIWVFGDRRRLDQALLNLVSNALRYTPHDEPIRVAVTASPPEVRWTVADRGPGIGDEDRAHLFERFFVGRGDRSARGDGVGLGLPIALAIAQAHDGRIDVETQPGIGSRFTIAVPADGPREADQR
jgi:two-component system phosphate regulon sensor histidine kinase PhoR